MDNEKISIIIPCFNREKYLSECLDSIFGQTLAPSQFEVIAVDDGSTDHTMDILQGYEERHPEQLLVVRLEQNSGGFPGLIRNIGMQYASGDWIGFVDSDDRVMPQMYQTMLEKGRATQADIVDCNYYLLFEEGGLEHSKPQETQEYRNLKSDVTLHRRLFHEMCGNNAVWSKLYRRSFLEKYEMRFAEDLHIAEDLLFHKTTMLYCETYIWIAEPLYCYRMNPQGIWNRSEVEEAGYPGLVWAIQEELLRLYEETDRVLDDEVSFAVLKELYELWKKCSELDYAYYEKIAPEIRGRLHALFPNLSRNPYFQEGILEEEFLHDILEGERRAHENPDL